MLQRNKLALYKDKDHSQTFIVDDLGDVESGKSISKKAWISNNTDYTILQVDYFTDDADLTIEDLPRVLAPREYTEVLIKYSPAFGRTTDLNTRVTLTGKTRSDK